MFKEAFGIIDDDSDGLVSATDLEQAFESLGMTPRKDTIASMLSRVKPGAKGINFAAFLSLMAELLLELDPEPELVEAFATFDQLDVGVLDADKLRKVLQSEGDRLTEAEATGLLSAPFVDKRGDLKYRDFCRTLRITDQAEQQQQADLRASASA